MSNVVQLFKKMTQEEAEEQILSNLKEMHHCKPVNFFCAIKGIDDHQFANTILDELITKRVVRVQRQRLLDRFGRSNTVLLYQYNILAVP